MIINNCTKLQDIPKHTDMASSVPDDLQDRSIQFQGYIRVYARLIEQIVLPDAFPKGVRDTRTWARDSIMALSTATCNSK